jgi:hypothetical protein
MATGVRLNILIAAWIALNRIKLSDLGNFFPRKLQPTFHFIRQTHLARVREFDRSPTGCFDLFGEIFR